MIVVLFLFGSLACMDTRLTYEVPPPPPEPYCEEVVQAGEAVALNDTCEIPDHPEINDVWQLRAEQRWSGLTGGRPQRDVSMPPLIANLTDDNLDGKVDQDDIPEIIFVGYDVPERNDGTLIVLDGATGDVLWTRIGWHATAGLAIADLDEDGLMDIVGYSYIRRPRAVTGDGKPIWASEHSVRSLNPQLVIAEVDGAYPPEVMADTDLLGSTNGSRRQTLPAPGGAPHYMPTIADLDQDGRVELIQGNVVFHDNGAVVWRSTISGPEGLWSAVVNADDDPNAEVLIIGGGRMGVYEHDGTEIRNRPADSVRPGPPCIADFDGDGGPEVGWSSEGRLGVYELTGESLWTTAVFDNGARPACSAYDFDADGIYELLFADGEMLYVFSGANGVERMSAPHVSEASWWEYPVVADVDKDGSAEIVLAASGLPGESGGGIVIYGHPDNAWLESGRAWTSHDFRVTNTFPDGRVPPNLPAPWSVYNLLRARPAVDTAATDLHLEIVETCWTGCEPDDIIQLTVRVVNSGRAWTNEPVRLSLYGDISDGFSPITNKLVGAPQLGGRASKTINLSLQVEELTRNGVLLRIDDEGADPRGALLECDERNNTLRWDAAPCPN